MSDRKPATIAGYTLGEELGAGGFGTVYRVQKDGLPDRAVKILNSELACVELAGKRFEREFATLRAVAHSNCVKVFESGRDADGNPYFVMELLEGRDLLHHLREFGRLAHDEVLDILKPVCMALEVAHRKGIIHRDIKSSNVFLCKDGRVVLLDFGIAKLLEAPGMTLTMTNQIVGTACAMSPEQLAGHEVSPQTDVYGLGSLAFHMFTGRIPFDTDSLTLTQYLHGHAARIAPSTHSPVSPEIDQVILRAMALDGSTRHISSSHFFKELARAVVGEKKGNCRELQGIVAHCRLGACGDSTKDALAAIDTLDAAATLLRESGFVEVCRGMRGFSYARVLDIASPAVADSDEVVEAVRTLILGQGPDDSLFSVRHGVLEMSGDKISGGQILEPIE